MIKKQGINYFECGMLHHAGSSRIALDEIKQFNATAENSLSTIQNKIHTDVSDSLKKLDEQYEDDVHEHYSYDIYLSNRVFPSLHRESIIITLLSLLEYQLNEHCKLVSECLDDKVKPNDLKGNGIERSKKYLVKIAEYNWSALTTWEELTYAQKVRNALVHNGGILDETKKTKHSSKNKNLKTEQIIRLNENNQNRLKKIIIEPNFVDELIQNMDKFFDELAKESLIFVNKP